MVISFISLVFGSAKIYLFLGELEAKSKEKL